MPLALFSMYMTSNPVLKSYLGNGSQGWSLLLDGLPPMLASCLCCFSSPAESYYPFLLFTLYLDCGTNAEAFGVDIRAADFPIFCLLSNTWNIPSTF